METAEELVPSIPPNFKLPSKFALSGRPGVASVVPLLAFVAVAAGTRGTHTPERGGKYIHRGWRSYRSNRTAREDRKEVR